jgi:hypothetical protein
MITTKQIFSFTGQDWLRISAKYPQNLFRPKVVDISLISMGLNATRFHS